MKEENAIAIIIVVFGVIMLIVPFDICFEGKIYKTICEISNIRDIAPNKMPFKSFVAFYNIAPIKWTLNKNYVVYKTIKDNIYKTPMKEYGFTFKLLDLIKYRIWHRGILHNEKVEKKKHEQKERYNQYQDVLKEISKDLEQFKQSKPWEDIKL